MTVTKRVRMSEEEAHRLARLASTLGKTESDVLREGIIALEAQRRRDEAWDRLIAIAERDKDVKWQKASGGWKP
jgi:predicted DNA-binding protein